MPLARKTEPQQSLPDALKKQISDNFKKESAEEEVKREEKTDGRKTKRDYGNVVNLRLTSGKRSEIKAFFSGCEISMNQGFEMAADYVIQEAKAGRIHISKSGIQKTEGQ